jgi:tetratricopeptide (TPR) repeat protein
VTDASVENGALRGAPGDLDLALKSQELALNNEQILGNLIGVAYGYGELGNISLARGDLPAAEGYYQKAVVNAKSLSTFHQAVQLRGLAKVYLRRMKYAPARDAYALALALDRPLGNPQYIAVDQEGLGQASLQLQRPSEACSASAAVRGLRRFSDRKCARYFNQHTS